MKRKNLFLIVLAFIFVLSSGCGNTTASTPSTAPTATVPPATPTAAATAAPSALIKAGTLHNTKTGIDIGLGMQKEAIDKLLGTPSVIGSFYFYANASITVSYTKNVAVILATAIPNWETMNKIVIGTASSDVKKLYGEPAASETYEYSFDKASKLTSDATIAAATMIFKFQNDKVSNINLVGKA